MVCLPTCSSRYARAGFLTSTVVLSLWLSTGSMGLAQETVAVPAELPRDLSPWGMYLTADWVVKSVLIGLLIASIVTWTVWLAKSIELMFAIRRLNRALKSLSTARSLGDAAHELDKKGPLADYLRAALLELQLSGEGMDRDGVRERVASRLDRIESRAAAASIAAPACWPPLERRRRSSVSLAPFGAS